MRQTEPLASERPLLRLDPRSGSLQQRRYQLTVLSGPDAGKVVALTGTLVVGSQPGLGLTLTDGAVSRHHVELHPQADGVRVRDLLSTNGTFVGAARVQEARVESGAVLKVGRSTLRLSAEEAADEAAPASTFGQGRAKSAAMQRLFGLLERVSASDSTVVLLGETGTGKDLLARGIHQHSGRRERPFVVVDCGAIAASLIESELFGHAKGAFTGAELERAGAFVTAHGGTLFLDEVGELPLEVQPKLLRVLETGEVKPVGEDAHRRVDVRVIAATHRPLPEDAAAGRFRQDLYFRLAVIPVRVPPLRERLEDLPLLVEHFLSAAGREGLPLPEALWEAARAYPWPGNVRELRNVVERLAAGGELLPGELSPAGVAPAALAPAPDVSVPYKEAKEQLVEAFTRAYLKSLHEQCGGNLTHMSRKAGIARNHLRELMIRCGLRAVE